jgi:hypothetical protein
VRSTNLWILIQNQNQRKGNRHKFGHGTLARRGWRRVSWWYIVLIDHFLFICKYIYIWLCYILLYSFTGPYLWLWWGPWWNQNVRPPSVTTYLVYDNFSLSPSKCLSKICGFFSCLWRPQGDPPVTPP